MKAAITFSTMLVSALAAPLMLSQDNSPKLGRREANKFDPDFPAPALPPTLPGFSQITRREAAPLKDPFTIISGGPAVSVGGGNAHGGNVGSGGDGNTGGNGGVNIGKRTPTPLKDPFTIISGGPAVSVGGGDAHGGNVGSGGDGNTGGNGGVTIGKRTPAPIDIPVTIISGGPAISEGGGNAHGGNVGSGGEGNTGGNGGIRIGSRTEIGGFTIPKLPPLPEVTVVAGGPAVGVGRRTARDVEVEARDEPLEKRVEIVIPGVGIGINGGHAEGGSTGDLKPGVHFRSLEIGKPAFAIGDDASAIGESVTLGGHVNPGEVIGGAAVALGKGSSAHGGDVNVL